MGQVIDFKTRQVISAEETQPRWRETVRQVDDFMALMRDVILGQMSSDRGFSPDRLMIVMGHVTPESSALISDSPLDVTEIARIIATVSDKMRMS